MNLEGKKIGFAFTGSFCTFKKTIEQIENLKKIQGLEITPIMSFNSYNLDTKFGKAEDFIKQIEEITNNKIIHTIPDAEPIGPKKMFDILIVAPCSGNTIAKLANDIIDTPVAMAVKSHLRNDRPVVIAISTNNALSGAAENIGKLLIQKLITDAKEIGYSYMLLDTLPFLEKAIHIYKQFGFYTIDCYNNSPMSTSIYMRLDL